jgi:hypothetical protein
MSFDPLTAAFDLKTERRWQVRKLIIATNLLLLGFAFFADYNGIVISQFIQITNGFQLASGAWFIADYATKPQE